MAIKNMTELRDELCEVIEQVKKDRRYVPQATEITNAAGKIINTLRVEMEYYKLSKTVPTASTFLIGETTKEK